MYINGVRPLHVVLIIAVLVAGLAADMHTGFAGQAAISAAVWALLLYLLAGFEREDRRALLACLVIATAGEILLSLGWGLYTYRLGNIPPFVPPGHVLMLLLGLAAARRLPDVAADAILACTAAYALAVAATGIDTLAVPLCFALAAVSLAMPGHRRLYASTFLASLVLELYGTWLGNWTWAREVPLIGMTTTNPPGVAGAFYAVLDALVAMTALLLGRRLTARPTRQIA
jgi:hypothetical protein